VKKVFLIIPNPNVFDYKNSRDNFSYRWFKLRRTFEKKKLELCLKEELDKNIKCNISLEIGVFDSVLSENKYLIIEESPHVRPQDWDEERHKDYKKIFTWDDTLIDNKKYFKLNYAFDIPTIIPKEFKNKKFCCTIAGNKSAKHCDELYTKRVDFIRWFENNHRNEFDLFGTKWDQYKFGHGLFGKILNKIKFLRKPCHFISYKGMVDSKYETMKNYKFSICYENIKDQNGYITEKIFDSFFAGCVPIYWGAKNITEHIPKECFIDKRDFNSFEEIYNYMKNMDEKMYMNYLEAIEGFLNSKKADPFRAETFADTIVSEISKDLECS
jgi:hypothetical protein